MRSHNIIKVSLKETLVLLDTVECLLAFNSVILILQSFVDTSNQPPPRMAPSQQGQIYNNAEKKKLKTLPKNKQKKEICEPNLITMEGKRCCFWLIWIKAFDVLQMEKCVTKR